jgi:hypothetical protein
MGVLGQLLVSKKLREWDEDRRQREAMQALYQSIMLKGTASQMKALEPSFKQAGIEITDDAKAILIGRDITAGALERLGGLGEIERMQEEGKELPHPSDVVSRREQGGERVFYSKVPQTERKAAEVKATREGELSFQQENIDDILKLKIKEMEETFPTKLAQQRQLTKMRQTIGAEISTGNLKDITLYDTEGNQRKASIPDTVASDPTLREGWITTNYPGWSEIKEKDRQLEDLKLSAWDVALKDPSKLTPAQKQLIGWEDRPNLSKAISIASRDIYFSTMSLEERMKHVSSIAEVLDEYEKTGRDIFRDFPNAKFDKRGGYFYIMVNGVKNKIEFADEE